MRDHAAVLFDTIGNFISYRIKKDAPLRMRTRAKSRVLPDGNRARRECAPRRTLFDTTEKTFPDTENFG